MTTATLKGKKSKLSTDKVVWKSPSARAVKRKSVRAREIGIQRRNDVAELSVGWMEAPIHFVPHPVFERTNPERELRRLAPLTDMNLVSLPDSPPGVAFIGGFVSQPLLTAAEEQSLFLRMNFHLSRAEQLRRRALASNSTRILSTQVRRELDRATQLRNRIVGSNLRLVISLAKKLSRSIAHLTELISEGLLPLIRSVELFDISLGYRFSTYATWSVRNAMFRSIKRAQAATRFFGQSPEGFLESRCDQSTAPETEEPTGWKAARVQRMLAGLSERDRFVLQARFGLAGESAGQSLAVIAERVGVSKERVRQIVLRSLAQLREEFPDPFVAR